MAGLAYILPDTGLGEIDFDLVESESHTSSSTVTDHPVETGVNVSDHVKPDSQTLTLDVFVSNTPLEPVQPYGGIYQFVKLDIIQKPVDPVTKFFNDLSASIGEALGIAPKPPPGIQALLFPSPFDKVADTHTALKTLERSGGTSVVVTSTTNYDNMVLTRVGYEKTEAGGGNFTLEFKQIRVVSTSTVAAPQPAEPRGAPLKPTGSQATSPVPDEPSKSGALKLAQGALGAMGLGDLLK